MCLMVFNSIQGTFKSAFTLQWNDILSLHGFELSNQIDYNWLDQLGCMLYFNKQIIKQINKLLLHVKSLISCVIQLFLVPYRDNKQNNQSRYGIKNLWIKTISGS